MKHVRMKGNVSNWTLEGCAAPLRPEFPDMPCMNEKCLPKQKGAGASVTARNEERPSSRGYTNRQPLVRRSSCCLIRFTLDFIHSYLSSPKPGHTTGRTGRTAHSGEAGGRGGAERGVAGRGGAGWDGGGWMCPGRRRDDAPRTKPFILPARAPKTTVLDAPPEARTREILCKPDKEHNVRLTTG